MNTKICTKCKKKKPLSDFHRNRKSKDGYHYRCKICIKEYDKGRYQRNSKHRLKTNKKWRRKNKKQDDEYKKKYYQEHKERSHFRAWKSRLKTEFRMIPEQYAIMLRNQNGCCLICKKHQTEFKKRFAVDHNRKTKKVRGLLCVKCNTGLGLFDHNINRLREAVRYLQKG